MEYTTSIKLDVNPRGAPPVVRVKQGDGYARYIQIQITKDGSPYLPGSNITYVFRCQKPDGTAVITDSITTDEETHRKFVVYNSTTGVITVELVSQTDAVAGRCLCDLCLMKDEQILSTLTFILDVMEAPDVANRIVSSDDFRTLMQAIAEVSEDIEDIDAAITNAEAAVEAANEAVSDANAAVANANSAANAATTAAGNASSAASSANSAASSATSAASAANTAADSATSAASSANSAASAANTAASAADTAKTNANNAASAANTAAGRVDTAISNAETATSNATSAASSANTAAESATTAAGNATTAANAANTAADSATSAAGSATSAASSANTAADAADAAATSATNAASAANTAAGRVDTAITDAEAATSAANTAASSATTAAGDANSAANAATTAAGNATSAAASATTAAGNADTATSAANSAASSATSAASAANTAAGRAEAAVTDANTAVSNANTAVSNANAAKTAADQAAAKVTDITATASALAAGETPTATVSGGTISGDTVTPYSIAFGIPAGKTPSPSAALSYQNSTSGTSVPDGEWSSTPNPTKGRYIWVKTVTTWSIDGSTVGTTTEYSVSYIGEDGTGAVNSVNSKTGDVVLAASDIATSGGDSIETALGKKVDAVQGKGLSANDYTNEEKSKLAGIAAGAEANVQSDWNQSDTGADDFIKNKPTIPSYESKAAVSGGTDLSLVTTGEKALWNTGVSVFLSLTLLSSGWSNAEPPTQTLTATGVTADNNVLLVIGSSATEDQYDAACDAKLMCTAQGANSITVTAYGDTPTENIPINVAVFGK